MTARREARLKPEFADLYPGLRPNVWYSAAWLSARQFARTHCDGEADSISQVLSDQHFEFRGGRPRGLRNHASRDADESAPPPRAEDHGAA